MSDFIEVNRRDDIETWTINRPERLNALGTTIGKKLLSELERLRSHRHQTRVLILSATPCNSNHGPVWIAGGDLKELKDLTKQQAESYSDDFSAFCQGLIELPIPVIASIHGNAIGGGAELALFTDLRLATTDTSFLFKQLEVGLTTGFGGTQRLRDLVGLGHTQRLLLLRESLDHQALQNLGLIHKVFQSHEDLTRETFKVAKELADLGPVPTRQQKKLLSQKGGYVDELRLFQDIWKNPSHEAFLSHW